MYYAKDYRKMARNSLKGHWPRSILVAFIAMILGGVSSSSILQFDSESGATLFGFPLVSSPANGFDSFAANLLLGVGVFTVIYTIIIFIIGGAIELGVRNYFLKLNYDMNPEVSELFAYMKIFGKALGLRIVMTIFIILWSCLFIIPGVIAFYRYSMATYLMAENPDMGIMEAINASKQMMIGNKWRLFCLTLSFIGWHILVGFTGGIGYILLHPYIEAAKAHFYLTLKHGMGTGEPS